jgi:hypothetical protein
VGLVWALELLASTPDFVKPAAVALAGLAALDPGGNSGPRPLTTLVNVLSLWGSEPDSSSASVALVLDAISEHNPEIAWKATLQLLSAGQGFAGPLTTPRFRRWQTASEAQFREDLITRLLPERLVLGCQDRPERWAVIVGDLGKMHRAAMPSVMAELERLDFARWTEDDRLQMWRALRAIVRQEDDEVTPRPWWALPRDIVQQLQGVIERLETYSPPLRYVGLFTHVPFPDYPERHEVEAELEGRQVAAVQEVLQREGIEGIVHLAALVESGPALGLALAKACDRDGFLEAVTQLIEAIGSTSPAVVRFFMMKVAEIQSQGWVEAALSSPETQSWSPEWRANLLFGLPCAEPAWDLVETLGGPLRVAYWAGVPLVGLGTLDAPGVEKLVGLLLQARQFTRALGLLALLRKQAPLESLVTALETAIEPRNQSEVDWPSLSWQIPLLMDRVRELDDPVRIMRLEWILFSFLAFHEGEPAVLLKSLGEDPHLFMELVTTAFKSRGVAEVVDEDRKARATRAYQLLDQWQSPPAVQGDGFIAVDKLQIWIASAQAEATASDRAEIANNLIGKALAHCRVGRDGIWPEEAVRTVLDESHEAALADGFVGEAGVRRGLHTVDPDAGGEAERADALKYEEFAVRLEGRSVNTAALLHRISQAYARSAERAESRALLGDFP